ncbi:hypothetical protein XENTR_v10017358 [Xenopus tropicalis]|uniref:Lymphocyte antigen 6E-like n=1 Tax=Xenopus tropicalis TaxID=8364 RepID=A0A8J1JV71_XENTR|nr:lymphocyte antigen 6E-like [Xenopus tropicalis]KAE8599851.1 hypothetical protein XENTR_v10017358 [Xenopus tropicalis]
MAASILILLVTALLIGTAYSFSCYTCIAQSRNEDCMSTTTCSASEPYCMTTVASAGIGSLKYTSITKTCSIACKASSFGTSLGSGSVSCCSTSLCNVSGASGIKYSYSALVLSLGLLLVLRRN